jgi:hypothetical protein
MWTCLIALVLLVSLAAQATQTLAVLPSIWYTMLTFGIVQRLLLLLAHSSSDQKRFIRLQFSRDPENAELPGMLQRS